jgi:uncharacterized membrane protein HdeD (DUF308 family)
MKRSPQGAMMLAPYLREVLAIIFGVIAILSPSFAYQIIGVTIGIYGIAYGGILGYRWFKKFKVLPDLQNQNLIIVLTMIALGVILILIPLTILKQTIAVLIIVALLGVAVYHLYFVRQQYINPLTFKNYLFGFSSIALALVVFFFINETSNLVMIALGAFLVIYSGYRLLMGFTKIR